MKNVIRMAWDGNRQGYVVTHFDGLTYRSVLTDGNSSEFTTLRQMCSPAGLGRIETEANEEALRAFNQIYRAAVDAG